MTGHVSSKKYPARGILLITLGTVFISTVPIFSKIVLRTMSSAHFSFFWMCFGLFYTIVFTFIVGAKKTLAGIVREWRYMLAAGTSAFVWVFFAFAGIKRLDPTVSIIFFNMRGVWGVLIGLTLLHERYSKIQYTGMAVILGGLALNLIDAGTPDEILGSIMTIVASLAYATTNSFIKRFIKRSGVVPALYARFVLPVLAFLVVGLSTGLSFEAIDGRTFALLATGAFIGPFLSFVMIFSSLKYLDLGVQTFFQSASLFITAILSYLVFASIPSPLQIAGGVIVITGMIVMSLPELRRRSAVAPTAETGGSDQ